MRQNNPIDFNVYNAPLDGKNLVEASAGTGKTYSIGILVLRMILEKHVPIQKILLVTFTKNAVAELEERIRLFVRLVHEHLTADKGLDASLKNVIANAEAMGISREEAKQRIKDAQLFLDELSIMTIHGFCQQSLANQSFETGQLFGGEVISSLDDIYMRSIRDFWRKQINTLPFVYYSYLIDHKYSMEVILETIKSHSSGKYYFFYDKTKTYRVNETLFTDWEKRIADAKATVVAKEQECQALINQRRNEIETILEADANGKKSLLPLLDRPDELMDKLIEKSTSNKPPQYISLLEPFRINQLADERKELQVAANVVESSIIYDLNCCAIQTILPKVNDHLAKAGILSYDELITNLHTAIMGPNQERITHHLREQYDAVFVDEFQDTDKLQYEIFKTAFGRDTNVFYVGDPKQSIYAFRQADIFTYFKARNEVDRLYTMNTNYRSTPNLIEAMNLFFLPKPDFDTFHFGQGDAIKYIPVKASVDNSIGALLYDGKPVTPLQIKKEEKKEKVRAEAAGIILKLLTDKNYKISKGGIERDIRPGDIGVLVRNNDAGQAMKELLNKKKIPAVILSKEKIMESNEAQELLLILKAMFDPDIRNIQAAILCSFTPLKTEEVIALSTEELTEAFRKYKIFWETRGVNVALSSFISDFGVRKYLSKPDTENGLRIISNLTQLTELLFKTEYHQRLKQAELIEWLQRATELELVEEDEKEIRLENDADSVTISTIHAAKGLEYPIVIAPQLDLTPTLKRERSSAIYIDENPSPPIPASFAGKYISIPNSALDAYSQLRQSAETQSEQENRRLLYVAITRAVYGCFIFKATHGSYNNSGLTLILNTIEAQQLPDSLILIHDDKTSFVTDQKFTPGKAATPRPARLTNTPLEIPDADWRAMSYSGLTMKSSIAPAVLAPTEPTRPDYDLFIFEGLRKGPVTGTMVHEIFEKIDFTNHEKHEDIINNIVQRYTVNDLELYQKSLPVLVQQVLSANITTKDSFFSLNQIVREKRLEELEFDFPVKDFSPDTLIDLGNRMGKDLQLRGNNPLSGMMNGFIDLFFEHEGKYYVLDWKTNFLGNKVEHYTGESLEQAMDGWNYHLQYLIYTLAVKKYLTQRLGRFDYDTFGGVLYCFVRGMRAGASSGVYFFRPEEGDLEELEKIISS